MEGHGFRPSPNFKHMKKYQKAKAHLSTLIEDTPPITPAQETKTVPQPFELPPKEVKQEPCLMPPLQPYEDLPPQPYEDLPPHPYEDLPPHPYEDLPPQLYEDLPPQPYEDMPPQPYENQPPLPPDIKPPLIDFKPPLPIVMQPPLPPHPPPVGIKREMNESEMQYLGASQQSTEYMDYEEMMPVENQPEEVMCRNFIRGICTRGSACIFSHKLIMSQLKDVYRFCNDFQNSFCKRPRCRFVHASVFEKEKFLRTGYLPEHTIAHMTENISVLPPPPPPPPEEPSVPMYYSMVPPPPPPPVTESVQASTDSMMMYAPGPSGYQASMQGQMQASHSSMQTSMPTTVQPVQTQIHDPLQAMQTSIINPSQAIQALMRNPPPTTIRAPSQASSNLRAKQGQAQVTQTTSQALRTAQMMKTSMQAPTQTMHASMHATPQPMQTSSQMMHSVSQMMPAPMQAPSQNVQASVQIPAQGMQVLMQTPSQSMHVSMQVPPPSMHVPPPTIQVPPPTMQVPPPTMQSTMQASHQTIQASHQTMQSPMHTSFQVMQSPIQASLQPIQTVSPQVQTGIDIYANPMPGTSSSTNTGWPQYEPSPSTSYEQVAPTVRSSTSCSSCDINDFRLKYNINKNEKLRRENEEMDRKLAELAVKKQVIYIFLAKIFKSNRSWCTTATADVDRQRALMEQLTALLSAGDL